jgi:endonuclease/exonuclease/phosphatase family metal-dependent hydrolase
MVQVAHGPESIMHPSNSVLAALVVASLAACSSDIPEQRPAPDAGSIPDIAEPGPDASREVSDEVEPDDGSDLPLAGPLVFFEGQAEDPDVRNTRLCEGAENPEALADPVFIECRLEGGHFAPADVPLRRDIRVLVWNIERGLQYDRILEGLTGGRLPSFDVLLLSELDRGCSRTGHRDVSRDLAKALGMDYVFATEFIELPRRAGGGGEILEACEHGNTILSRYPLANVGWFFHEPHIPWFGPSGPDATGEPRLGGRVLLWADVVVGRQLLRVYTVHYESSPLHRLIQAGQAEETAAHAEAVPWQAVVGGDTNNVGYFADLRNGEQEDITVAPFLRRGWVDAHIGLDPLTRGTRGIFVIDLLLGNGDFFSEADLCPASECTWSDHQPVWATVRLDGEP